MPESLNQVQKVLVRLIRSQLPSQAREVTNQLHEADLAGLFRYFTKTDQERFVKVLVGSKKIGKVLSEVDEDDFATIRDYITDEVLIGILQNMPTDDATDIINYLPEEEREAIFRKLTGLQKRFVGQLLGYEENTAGGIMTTEVHAFPDTMKVSEAIERLRHEEKQEVVLTVYVISAHKKLVGVAPFKSLVFAALDQELGDIMEKDPISVDVEDSREDAAQIMAQYDLLSLPVVNESNELQGMVTIDDAIDVMYDEATEDMFKLANLDVEEQIHSPVPRSIRMRLPWMLFNLATITVVAITVNFFIETIKEVVALAVLMPMIAGMGGNAGTQALTVVVRGLALGELDFKEGIVLLFKEARVGLIAGIVVGIAFGLITYVWFGNYVLGIIGCAAMLVNLVLACLIGAFVPLMLKKLNLDPALGSSMFVTMAADIGGFVVFLGLAAVFIEHLRSV